MLEKFVVHSDVLSHGSGHNSSGGMMKKNKVIAIDFDFTYEIPLIYRTQDYILFSNNTIIPELMKWYLLVSIENTKGKFLLVASKEKEVWL